MQITARIGAWLTGVVVLAAGLLVPVAGAASADPVDCTYAVSLPAKVIVKKAVVGLTAKLAATTTTGANCTGEFSVSTHLVHGTDDELLMWDQDNATTDTESLYAFEVVPGTYKTDAADCYATSADFLTTYSCAVGSASTVIKFGSTTKLKMARTKNARKRVTFTVRSTHFTELGAAKQAATVRIQRYSHGKWHTVHTAKTKRKTGSYTWTHRYPKKAKYRAVSSATSMAWGSESKAAKR